jgi:hypothetical protein
MLCLLVASTVLKQQRQEQTRSAKYRISNGIRSNSNQSVVYKALEVVHQALLEASPSLTLAAAVGPLRTSMARNILLIIRGTTIHRRVDTFVVIQIHRATITISTDMTLEHEQLGSAPFICDHQRPRIRASGAPAGHPPDPSDAGACL